jgi:hypothetical protein
VRLLRYDEPFREESRTSLLEATLSGLLPLGLMDVQPIREGTAISYRARNGVIVAVLEFNAKGKIAFLRIGPPK